MVIIVDYGMGNLRSVANAFEVIGVSAEISADPNKIREADRLVIPGVGAFGEAMARLRERRLIEPLEHAVQNRKRPVLGICLGMQLLAARGFEHGEHDGLGWIPGEVRRIDPTAAHLRIPHIGWNAVAMKRPSPLCLDLAKDPTFYFVHSYHFVPDDPAAVVGVCEYGSELTAIVGRELIFGTQFHPEKSQRQGLALLRNFAQLPC